MIELRQNTAGQEIPLGIMVDATDGNTAETTLTIANTDVRIWKWGATTLTNKNSGGAIHIDDGIYYLTLDATDTNTLGPMVIFVHVSGALYARVECAVLVPNVWDSRYASDYLQVDAVQVEGSDATDQINAACDTALSDYDGPTNAEMEARTLEAASYATAGNLATVDGIVDSILEDTGTTLPAQVSALNNLSAQQVWEYVTRTLTSAGSGGATAQEVWEYATRTLTAGTKDSEIDTIASTVAAILVDTGTDIPALLSAIAGYLDTEVAAILEDTGTTIPGLIAALNNLSSAQAQDAATAALNAYDPPTNAELVARTLPTADYATATNLAALQVDVTEILDYEAGDWAIVNNQMIFYTKAGAVLAAYNLTKDGVADSDAPDARTLV